MIAVLGWVLVGLAFWTAWLIIATAVGVALGKAIHLADREQVRR